MSTKYFCDFCGDEMPNKTEYCFAERVEYAQPIHNRKFELCEDCRDEIVKHIDDKLKKE